MVNNLVFELAKPSITNSELFVFQKDKEIKGDVLLEFSSVKWVLNEDHTLYCNILGTLLLQNFVLVNSYFNEFFVAQAVFDIIGIRFM